jgi:hypothetical protein
MWSAYTGGGRGQLAAAISDLITHPQEALALGDRARLRCLEHYSMRRVGDTLQQVIDQVATVGVLDGPAQVQPRHTDKKAS